MTLYHMSVKCPHCDQLTFVEQVDTNAFHRAANLLKPVLHSFVCGHCQKSFGPRGELVRDPIPNV